MPEERYIMKVINVNTAMGEALSEEMNRDSKVMLLGEGVQAKYHALAQQFGELRVRNTPLAEAVVAGTAVGAAASGLRPVVDLLFAPFLTYAMDAIVNSAGKLRFVSGGQFEFPVVFLALTGAGWGVGAQHNHNIEAWFAHAPGLKVVMPSTPADFKGLLKASIRDNNPVVFFCDLALGPTEGPVQDGDASLVPIGKAVIRRSGTDLTLVSYGKTVGHCMEAARLLEAGDISVEIIDLRTIKPWDRECVLESVKRTGRLLVVHEAAVSFGVGAEISAFVAEHAFHELRSPITRLGGPDAPAPASWVLEQAGVPQALGIAETARNLIGHSEPIAALP